MDNFINITGYCLGILIVFCVAFICASPVRSILKLITNSILGCTVMSLFNYWFASGNFSAGLNPFTAVLVGALGIPGAAVVIIVCLIL